MAKSRENFSKQDNEKNKERKRKEKEQRREERKAAKGNTSFEDMIAYVDENGNITSTPPDPTRKKVIKEEDIEINVPRQSQRKEEITVRWGRVTFFNDSKGYGFIKDQDTQESIFVHINQVDGLLVENDKVTFEVERGPKGLNAVRVKVSR
ncbi:MAG TPA: cold shock domain-containing protein [Chryseosolibacter sp.]|nr:cold shock domain-containing protein [Chryseosolibacter sp.]